MKQRLSHNIFISLSLLSLLLTSPAAFANEAEDNAAAQANNPLANMTAFNIQNYYIGELTETDEDANQF